MATAKVTFNNTVLIDLTGDTAQNPDVVSPKTFHKADGSGGTGSITERDSSDLTASGATVSVPAGHYESPASKAVASMTLPTGVSVASSGVKKATITQNADGAGYLNIPAGYNDNDQFYELPQLPVGTKTIDANGTYNAYALDDLIGYSEVVVNVPSGGVDFDTKTVTASDYPTSLQFDGMKGRPKAFVLRLNASVSSSGSTTYYYIVGISAFGDTTHGNCFRVGGTRQVTSLTSGYSWSYSGTTLTITSSAKSRSYSPGAFYNGSYELMYCY